MVRKNSESEEGNKINKIIVVKKDLLDCLTKMSFALSKKDIGRQTNHYIFLDDRLHVYSDEIYVSFPFKFPVSFSVEGATFLKIVNSLLEEKVIFDLDLEKEILKMSTENVKAKISINKNISVLEEIKVFTFRGRWDILPKQVLEGVGLCGFSTSEDLTRGNLYCVSIYPECILSTDDIRLSRYGLQEEIDMKENSWFIPSLYTDFFSKSGFEWYLELNSWLYFKNKDDFCFGIRKIKGVFLKDSCTDIFFKDKEGSQKFNFPKEISSYLESILGLLDDMLSYDKIVRLQCKDNMLKCIIEKEHLYKERSFAVKKDVSFDFLINPVFLKQILNRGSTFYINEEKHKMYFISKNFSHVLSLCIG